MKTMYLLLLSSILCTIVTKTNEYPISVFTTGTLPNKEYTEKYYSFKNLESKPFNWDVHILPNKDVVFSRLNVSSPYTPPSICTSVFCNESKTSFLDEKIDCNPTTVFNKKIKQYKSYLQINTNTLYDSNEKKIYSLPFPIQGRFENNNEDFFVLHNNKDHNLLFYNHTNNTAEKVAFSIKNETVKTHPKNNLNTEYITFESYNNQKLIYIYIVALNKYITLKKKIGNKYSKIMTHPSNGLYISSDKSNIYYPVSTNWNNTHSITNIAIKNIASNELILSDTFNGFWDIITQHDYAIVSKEDLPFLLLDLKTNKTIPLTGLDIINKKLMQEGIFSISQKNDNNPVIEYQVHSGKKYTLIYIETKNNQNERIVFLILIDIKKQYAEILFEEISFEDLSQNNLLLKHNNFLTHINKNCNRSEIDILDLDTKKRTTLDCLTIEKILESKNGSQTCYIIKKNDTTLCLIHIPSLTVLTFDSISIKNRLLNSLDVRYNAEKNLLLIVTESTSTTIKDNDIETSFELCENDNDIVYDDEVKTFKISCINTTNNTIITEYRANTYKFIEEKNGTVTGLAYQIYSNNPLIEGANEHESVSIINFNPEYEKSYIKKCTDTIFSAFKKISFVN